MMFDCLAQSQILALAVLALSGTLANCSNTLSALDLYPALDRICPVPETACTIDLSKITDFEWDRVVFVKMTAATTLVAAEVGVEHIEREEFEDIILFLKAHEIQRVVKRKYHPEKPFSKTVFCDFSKTRKRYLIFDKSQAIFKATRAGTPDDNFLLSEL